MSKRPRTPDPSADGKDGLPDDVRQELANSIGNIVERNKREAVIQRVEAVVSRVSLFSGPLPPAEQFEQYERVLPGCADRIVTMAESALTHNLQAERDQIALDKAHAASDAAARKLGLICGFLCFVLLVVCAFAASYFIDWKAGAPFLAVGVVSIIPQFLNAHRPGADQKPGPQ
jgi:uncharacterized membrane protein